jgi:hypothetical protein
MGAFFLFEGPRQNGKDLSEETRRAAAAAAKTLAPLAVSGFEAILPGAHALLQDSNATREELDAFADRLEHWNAQVDAEVDKACTELARGDEKPEVIRSYLLRKLREQASVAELARLLSVAGGASFGRLLAAPRLSLGPAIQAQEEFERLVGGFVDKYLSAGESSRKEAYGRVIRNLRKIGVIFDTEPPTVGLELSPRKPGYNLADLTAGVEVLAVFSDSVSGIDGSSLRFSTVVDGVPFSLQAASIAVDPILGSGSASLILHQGTIPDGFVTLTGAVCDPAGNCASDLEAFIKDVVPPGISIVSPASGITVISSTLHVLVELTDEVSGIEPARTRVLLDGNDITLSLAVDAMEMTVRLSGDFPIEPGDHVLEVACSDVVLNESRATSIFKVENEPGPPRLEVVGGDGQRAVAGRPVAEDLVVRAVDDQGRPVEGVFVRFESDGGLVFPSETLPLLTGSDGMAGVSFVADPTPGRNVVSARPVFGNDFSSNLSSAQSLQAGFWIRKVGLYPARRSYWMPSC